MAFPKAVLLSQANFYECGGKKVSFPFPNLVRFTVAISAAEYSKGFAKALPEGTTAQLFPLLSPTSLSFPQHAAMERVLPNTSLAYNL